MIDDKQKQQHFHLMCALDHLQQAGFKDMKLIEAMVLMSTVILGDKDKMKEVLDELSEYEKQCQEEQANSDTDEKPSKQEVH